MILISAFYVVSCTPVYVYFMLANVKPDLTLVQTGYYIRVRPRYRANARWTPLRTGYYIIVFVSFFYICANPFVYAVKFDPVRRVLIGMVPCKKTSTQEASTATP